MEGTPLNATWLRTMGLPLRVVPALLLVVFAGLVGLIALFCPRDRRDYALNLVGTWTSAACMISLGESKVALPRTPSPPMSKQAQSPT